MNKETKHIVKKCMIFIAILYFIDIITTIILVGFLGFKEVGVIPAALVYHFGFWNFVLIAFFIIIPLVIFLYALLFPILFNLIIPEKYKWKQKVVRFVCYIGILIVAYHQLQNISRHIWYIINVI